jgi:thiol-disulfide isomerase/thioredoxin
MKIRIFKTPARMKSQKQLLFFFALIFSIVFQSYGQNSYKITIQSNAFKDTVYMGYYYGKFQYAKDTAVFNNKGVAVFENKTKSLERGVYFFVFPNKKHLDFIINNEQNITFVVDTSDVLMKTKVTGSKENQTFIDYNKAMVQLNKQFETLSEKKQKYANSNHDSLAIIDKQIQELSKKSIQLKEDIINKNPKSLISKIFLLTKDPDIPPLPIKEDGSRDSAFAYQYYKANYWENMDFTDDALVRSPVIHPRIERFFTQVLIQHPDTIIKELTPIIEKAQANPEVFKYFVWFLTFHFETSEIMGHDAVFVHLVDQYYATGKAFWASETVVQRITERANKLRPILLGKIAPNMALLDTNLTTYTQLWSVQADFTVMVFWDPDCGHCKKELDRLNTFFNTHDNNYNIAIYSVCTDTNLTKWINLIHEKEIQNWVNVNATRSALGHYHELYDVIATPLIYLLDKEKRIIAKRISAQNVGPFIKQHIAIRNKETPSIQQHNE